MSRISKTAIQSLLDEWSQAEARRQRIEAERNRAIQPLRDRFEKASAPINEEATRKLQPIQEKLNALTQQITEAMKAGVGANGEIKLPQVAGDAALAEISTDAQRELEPELFFQETPASERTPAFWSCVKIQIGKAEKFLGSRIDELAQMKRTFTVRIRAK